MFEKYIQTRKGILFIVFLLVSLYTLPQIIEPRELWYSDEVRHAATYHEMQESQNYFILSLNGQRYTDKPPLYFWLLTAIEKITGFEDERIFFVGVLVSVLAFVCSAYVLALATSMPMNVLLASVCMCFTTVLTFALTQFSRMDMLFAATINFSFAYFYIAWIKPRATKELILAFSFAGLGCLIKGPFAFAFPIISSIIFLAWSKNLKRFFSTDTLYGFLCFLAILFIWIGGIIFSGELDYIIETYQLQIDGRAVNAWRHAAPWYYYLVYVPILLLPFSVLPLADFRKKMLFSFKEVLRSREHLLLLRRQQMQTVVGEIKTQIESDVQSIEEEKDKLEKNLTKEEQNELHQLQSCSEENAEVCSSAEIKYLSGRTWLYSILLTSLVILSVISSKLAIYALPLFPPILIVLSQYLVSFSEQKKKYFFGTLSLQFLALGLVFLILPFYNEILSGVSYFLPELISRIPDHINLLLGEVSSFFAGVLFLFFSYLIYWGLQKLFPVQMLLMYVICFGVSVWLLAFTVLADISPYFSTKKLAHFIKQYAEEGYTPITYNVYSGTFTYYAERNLIEVKTPEQLEEVIQGLPRKNTKATLLLRTKDYIRLVESQNPHIRFAEVIGSAPVATIDYTLLIIDMY